MRLPAVPWNELPAALRQVKHVGKWGKLDSITVGGTGLGKASARRQLAAGLHSLARTTRVIPDFELAFEQAFGEKPGIVVVAGTGSVAFGRNAEGRSARAGGFGPILGDEGSGFWIASQALESPKLKALLAKAAAARARRGRRQTAGLARRVLALAAKNPEARALRRRAAEELAALARALASRLRLSAPVPIALHGGLFRDAGLRRDFLSALKKIKYRACGSL